MLTMFMTDEPSNILSPQNLTIKTAMLLVLMHPCGGADLAKLDLTKSFYFPEEVVSNSLTCLSSHVHHITTSVFPQFKEKCLCPLKTLRVYEERTVSFLSNPGKNRLFTSFIGKYGPVSLYYC